jgi:hypothetical protein
MSDRDTYPTFPCDAEQNAKMYEMFNTWIKSYTFIVQGKLKKICELRDKLSAKGEDIFDSPSEIIKLCGCHPDTLDEYILKLEEKLLPYNDYEDEFNGLLGVLKKTYPKEWVRMHPFYTIPVGAEVDWNQGVLELKKLLGRDHCLDFNPNIC